LRSIGRQKETNHARNEPHDLDFSGGAQQTIERYSISVGTNARKPRGPVHVQERQGAKRKPVPSLDDDQVPVKNAFAGPELIIGHPIQKRSMGMRQHEIGKLDFVAIKVAF
jgi:hypothetical protein